MWITILGLLGPLLVQLAQGCGKDPVKAANDAYDAESDTFSEPVVHQAMIQTRHAIRMAKRQGESIGRISRDDIRSKAIEKLREGLTATPEAVAACAAQIADLPDLGDEE
jgi:hypothetical protein